MTLHDELHDCVARQVAADSDFRGLNRESADCLVRLHTRRENLPLNLVRDYTAVWWAVLAGKSVEKVSELVPTERTETLHGVFRVHCRTLRNRSSGVSDISLDGVSDRTKAPAVLQLLDGTGEDVWRELTTPGRVATHFLSVARRHPSFDRRAVCTFQAISDGERSGSPFTPADAKGEHFKQGWVKFVDGVCDGVEYLHRFGSGKQFHEFVTARSGTPQELAALLRGYERSVRNVGPALAPSFFGDLGYKEFVKPDVHVKNVLSHVLGRTCTEGDVLREVPRLADRAGLAPRQLDKLMFLAGSGFLYLVDRQIKGSTADRRRRELADVIVRRVK